MLFNVCGINPQRPSQRQPQHVLRSLLELVTAPPKRRGTVVPSWADNRALAIFADVDYFSWPDGRQSLANFFSNHLIMGEAVPGNMNDHDSKSERRQVVLMFKPLVDRHEHIAPSPQMLYQDFVGKASPAQTEDADDGVVGC